MKGRYINLTGSRKGPFSEQQKGVMLVICNMDLYGLLENCPDAMIRGISAQEGRWDR